MKKRIKNTLSIGCNDVDLTTVSNIEFYLKQSAFFRQYTPLVIDAHEMLVEIPFEDAKTLAATSVKLQFAFTDADGNHRASEIREVMVGDLLKEAGYDPV